MDNLELVKISYKNFNQNIFITGCKNKNAFVIFDKSKHLFAKIYERKARWFVYYVKLGYRIEVSSFTDGMNMVEQEIEKSWKSTEN